MKDTIQSKKHRNIAILCTLCVCVAVAGFSAWFFVGKDAPATEDGATGILDDLGKEGVPLDSFLGQVSTGDVVVVNVFADEMYCVYGYQFDINYNKECLEYRKRLHSDIDEIITIFATDKEQQLLIGATMVGDAKGYSGQGVPVCRVEFVAVSDFELEPDFAMKYVMLSTVNVVTDDLQYLENVDGWAVSLVVQSL